MFKKVSVIVFCACVALFSMQSQAALIKQDIVVNNLVADPGNAFGIASGFSGIIGHVMFDTDNVDAFGDVNAATDPSFFLQMTLGNKTFTMFDDLDFPDFPVLSLDPASLMAGMMPVITGLDTVLVNGGDEVEVFFFGGLGGLFATDASGNTVQADITFVPEPSAIALLVLGGLMLRLRRR
ncbi:PEP-CTERM sorting domain-containing protein [Aestuariibacter sp. AA17]|uniref:PEP-CTERM sorting domain-containing protein n=1 Tax=Fluctibacter corallii TaxID=2984329 RepID=A0ABT3A468_9ALTE|nr:PEP-CTERM sorting domain-containing protein [Aestuariibacter sp. AA17]MCV2883491.1 PEP-CTERM sorting domain-containing protein [Aestuariibacter sp. AA17]